jgi:Bacterial Ig-like domain
MTTGKRLRLWTVTGLALLATACSSSDGTTLVGVDGVVQNLTLDPDGLTTVLTLEAVPAFMTVSNVQANGGQTAQIVSMAGAKITVVWDTRVTPSDKVRVVSVPDVESTWRAVTSSDASAPTFVVTSAVQDTSDAVLGGDTIRVTFSGPRVVETEAEDLTNWTLTVNGQAMDLTGSTLALDPATQILDFTLGASANLHATFTLAATSLTSVSDTALSTTAVAGAATGDTTAPTLASIEQNLAQDEFGRVVDLSFDEPMDPVFAAIPGAFSLVNHVDAVGVTLITSVVQPDASTLRLTFSRPVAPGLDTLSHTGLMDAHGNAFAAATEALANSSPTVNAFGTITAATIEGGADTVTVTTTQALDPDFAEDPARWTMTIDAGAVVMANQTLSYDYLSKTLNITLDSEMRNGDAVVVNTVAQVDVDGQGFTATAGSVSAAGDASAPTFVSAVQNRTVDPTGYTVDLTFSEALHLTQGQDATNYTFTPAGTVTSATVIGAGNMVRVVTSDLVLTPSDVTVTIDSDVDDLAGNALGSVSGPNAMTSSDSTSPVASVMAGTAAEGADNDTIVVTFDDDMVQAEVENEANWTVESPVGTSLNLNGATIAYNVSSRSATVTLDAGNQTLKFYDDLQTSFVTMRDIGGNTIGSSPIGGSIGAEQTLPTLHTVWRHNAPQDGTLELRFSEPTDNLTDIYNAVTNPFGTRYALRDSGGALRGYPNSATSVAGGLGARLEFGFTIALTDTLDVLGVEDLAGNVMFPAMAYAIDGEDLSAPTQSGSPTATAVSGEGNDTIVVTFSTDMSPWQVMDPAQYTVTTNPGSVPVSFAASNLSWDGAATVTIDLRGTNGDSLQATQNYDVTLNLASADPLRSDQGVSIAGADTQTVGVSGDTTTGPSQGSSLALVDVNDGNSLIVVFDEAVDETSVEVAANFDYDGGNLATSVTLLSSRVVRATFGVAVSPGFNLVIAQASAVDLAGNDAGADMTLAVTADSSSPLISSLDGVIGVGLGGDRILVVFNEQIDTVTGLDVSNYAFTNGSAVDLIGAALTWDSVAQTVTVRLSEGVDLDASQVLSATISGIADAAGNVMPAPVALSGSLTGDATAPGIASAWTNRQADNNGTTVDVLFDEDVDQSFAGQWTNWGSSGGASVTAVEVLDSDHVRLTLDLALLPTETVDLSAGLEDSARNAAGSLSQVPIDPTD